MRAYSVSGGISLIERGAGHRFDYTTPIEETMQALHDVVQAGWVRYIGMSSCHAYQCTPSMLFTFLCANFLLQSTRCRVRLPARA